jgi:hypothetical protein
MPASVVTFIVVLGLSAAACGPSTPSAPRYIVTATPVDLVGVGHPGLCVAVDPADEHGVWWWEPGPSGCSRRTTGPTVLRAQLATVATSRGSSDIEVRFQLPLMSGSRDVRLQLQEGSMRVMASGARVPTARRADLNIPPAYGR